MPRTRNAVEAAVTQDPTPSATMCGAEKPPFPDKRRKIRHKTYTAKVQGSYRCYSSTGLGPKIRICTAGYSYRSWHAPGSFYGGLPASTEFEVYATEFNCLELNATFYGGFKEETFDRWRQRATAVRSSFQYVLKAPSLFTHKKKLHVDDTFRDSWTTFWGKCQRLGSHLGPVLFQLPPRMHRTHRGTTKGGLVDNLEKLQALSDVLPRGGKFVFEFRDKSWFVPEVYEVLRRHDWCLALIDVHWGGGTRTSEKWCGTLEKGSNPHPEEYPLDICSWGVYIRFHGAAGQYIGDYGSQRMAKWAEIVRDWASTGRTVYVSFNNTDDGIPPSAICDARNLASGLRCIGAMD